ncbi:hypothetical protein [Mucilaginibacter gotjawali]|uniref:Uncharacterized protein n=2 Tax=Mucilaginibacter gotjawali TaxID=1550579 RepID=A0A110B1K8_9SPHI|nr:hypothetical protein [Mucilaginibacter gotjawali]MBB3057212.1 hypothetical protein [Mucilaginibacter gotjawali]BAU53021.1 hypothetical protein MgSA37_01188 [Mucilaginibacter gotjawali]
MKRNTPVFFLISAFTCALTLLSACGGGDNSAQLRAQADSLNKKLAQTYRPGLGEFMMGIQIHHAKIWYAGKNQNWALANFEVGEIKETLEDVKQYCNDRPEVKSLPIIYPALDSLSSAIKAKNLQAFQKGFILLTKSCNDCHQTTHHEFNVIKTPETPPFTNQEFKGK